jgi:hypothetical protein
MVMEKLDKSITHAQSIVVILLTFY